MLILFTVNLVKLELTGTVPIIAFFPRILSVVNMLISSETPIQWLILVVNSNRCINQSETSV